MNIAGSDSILMVSDAVLSGPEGAREGYVNDIRKEEKIVDIGPATAAKWAALVESAPVRALERPDGHL
jgi:3-phosphoglycerate kinase